MRPTPLKREAVENLVLVGAFDAMYQGTPRRQLLWEVKEACASAAKNPLVRAPAGRLELPPMTELEVTAADYNIMALTTGRHIVSYYRDQLQAAGAIDSRALKTARNKSQLRVAGLVITRQAPGTAKKMRFFTLEDEWGHINLVLTPDFFTANRHVANRNQMLMFDGEVQHVDGVISILARAVSALPEPAVSLGSKQRLPP